MLISDVSVRRPVFAAVISLILVIVGLMSLQSMSIREYPDIQRPVVSVSTSYRGAASDIVERRVTQIIEDQIAGISGISTAFGEWYGEPTVVWLAVFVAFAGYAFWVSLAGRPMFGGAVQE